VDIGTGIFGGSVVIGSVALYISTRDRWKWKRLLLRAALTLTALIAIVGAFIWGQNVYENRVVKKTEFQSVRLQDTIADIKFKKGEPDQQNENGLVFNTPSGDGQIFVGLKDGRVKMVLYRGDCPFCYNIYGLGVGTSYDEVIEKLGPPSFTSISKDSLERLLSFEEAGLVFHMAKGKVTSFGIYNPSLGAVRFKEEANS
jgi:hypothetical protein